MNPTNTAKRLIELSKETTGKGLREWREAKDGSGDIGYMTDSHMFSDGCFHIVVGGADVLIDEDSKYIAAANPKTITSICNRLLELEEILARHGEQCEACNPNVKPMAQEKLR